MKAQFVLISFDLDSKRADSAAYAKAFEVFASYGLTAKRKSTALPNTTVAGEMSINDGATADSISTFLRGVLVKESVPLTRMAVAFFTSASYSAA